MKTTAKTQTTREAIQARLDKVTIDLKNRDRGDQIRLNYLEGMKVAYEDALELLPTKSAPETQPSGDNNQEEPETEEGTADDGGYYTKNVFYSPDTPTRPASRPKNKVAAIVTEQLIKRMNDSGKLPWRKPWTSEGVPLAVNYVSRKPYRGINRLMLEPGEYISFKQIQERKGHIIKGSHAHYVIFSKPLFKRDHIDENGEVKTDPKTGKPYKPYRFMLRYYRVFSLDDVKGIESKLVPLDPKATKIQPDAKAQAIIDNYLHTNNGLKYTEKLSDRAFYSPSGDSITVPHRSQYDHTAEFYSTNFHESAHSTGHETRLKRDMSGGMRSHAYSKEELVAEITAAFLCRECRLDTEESFNNSAAYLQGWTKKLKENENLIIIASAQAEKAYNYIMTDFDETTVKNEPAPEPEQVPDATNTPAPIEESGEEVKDVWRVVYEMSIKKYLVVNQGGYAYKNFEFTEELEASMASDVLNAGGEYLPEGKPITPEPMDATTEEENAPQEPAESQQTLLFCPDRPDYYTQGAKIDPNKLKATSMLGAVGKLTEWGSNVNLGRPCIWGGTENTVTLTGSKQGTKTTKICTY